MKPTVEEVVAFINTLQFPKLASFVVNKLMQHFEIERDEAIVLWNEAQDYKEFHHAS